MTGVKYICSPFTRRWLLSTWPTCFQVSLPTYVERFNFFEYFRFAGAVQQAVASSHLDLSCPKMISWSLPNLDGAVDLQIPELRCTFHVSEIIIVPTSSLLMAMLPERFGNNTCPAEPANLVESPFIWFFSWKRSVIYILFHCEPWEPFWRICRLRKRISKRAMAMGDS